MRFFKSAPYEDLEKRTTSVCPFKQSLGELQLEAASLDFRFGERNDPDAILIKMQNLQVLELSNRFLL
jgi:hypothetical protein